MIRGAWMYRREDDAVLKICCAPRQNDKPCADSERAQKWRMSLASLLFFTVLLSDHLWLCAGAKFRSKDRGLGYTNNNATGDGGGEVYLRITSNPNLQLVVGDPHFVEAGRCEDIFISNLTKSAAPVPPCIGAHVHLDLDSACTQLQSLLQGDCTSSLSLNKSSLLAYFKSFSLSFCDSYTISDLLLSGMARGPDSLNCSLENLILDLGRTSVAGDWEVCSSCVQAYQTLDQHAQEKYEEFDSLLEKYLQGEEYSVRSCLGDCKVVYKAWLCSEYFNVTQQQCHRRMPCKQYCQEVQTRCPFLLPDNDDVIYGGLPGFICTGPMGSQLSTAGPECCDVRWSSCDPSPESDHSASTKSMDSISHQHRSSLLVSAGSRLASSRLRFCVLFLLILLHTVVTFSALQSSSGVSLEGMSAIDESSTTEE